MRLEKALGSAMLAVTFATGACTPASEMRPTEAVTTGGETFLMRAACSGGGFQGSYSFEIWESTSSRAARLAIHRVRGPNGDVEETEPQAFTGHKLESTGKEQGFLFPAYEIELAEDARERERFDGRLLVKENREETTVQKVACLAGDVRL